MSYRNILHLCMDLHHVIQLFRAYKEKVIGFFEEEENPNHPFNLGNWGCSKVYMYSISLQQHRIFNVFWLYSILFGFSIGLSNSFIPAIYYNILNIS